MSTIAKLRAARRALPRRRIGILRLWALARQRRRLRELDPFMLDDIGVDRAAAEREAARQIWDVPDTWRR